MSQNSTPWYLDDAAQLLSPRFSDSHGYFPYKDQGIISADTTTGEINWTYQVDLLSLPFFYNGKIACPGHQSIHIVDNQSGECINQITYPSPLTAPPITTHREDLFLAGCTDGFLYGKTYDDAVCWKTELSHSVLGMVPLSQEVLVGYSVDSLDTIDLQKGTNTWGYHLPTPVSTGPVQNSEWFVVGLENGVVYLFSQGEKSRVGNWVFDSKIVDIELNDETIVVATESEIIRIDINDKNIDWSVTVENTCHSVTDGDDMIYVAMNDGSLGAFDSSSGEKICRIHCEIIDDAPVVGFDDELYLGIRGYGYLVVKDPATYSGAITIDDWSIPGEQLLGRLDSGGIIRPIGKDLNESEPSTDEPISEPRSSTKATTTAETPASEITSSVDTTAPSVMDTGTEAASESPPWEAELDSMPFLPTLTNSGVSVSTPDGTLKMLAAETGKPLWDVRIAGSFSTKPYVYSDQLVLLCEDHTLRTFDQETGDEILRLDIPSHEWSSVEIWGSIACLVANDGEVIGADLKEENVIWERSFGQPADLPPFTAVSKFNIILGGDLYRIDPEQGANLLHCSLDSRATATAVHGGQIYYGTSDGTVHIIDLVSLNSDGLLKFENGVRGIVSSENNLYIITEGELLSVDPDTYENLWIEEAYEPTTDSIALYDDLVIVTDANGSIIVRGQKGQYHGRIQLESSNQLSVVTDSEQVLFQDSCRIVAITNPETPESLIQLLQQSTLGDKNDAEEDSIEETESELEETISELKEAVLAKNEQLSELSDALEAKEERIATLEDTLNSKEERISTLSQYYNDVLENTVRPLLQCLIGIHARQSRSTANRSDELRSFIEDTLRQQEVSIRNISPGDEYSSTYHESVDTIQGAHPPDTIVEVQSPCYEWEFDDSILQPAKVVVSDGSQSLQQSGVVDGEVIEISGAKCVYEGTISEAPRTRARVTSLSVVDDEELVERFTTAVRRWEQLGTHPNTVNPIAWDTDPIPWVAQPLDGYQQLTDELSSLGWDDRLSVITDVAESLRNADKYNTRHPSLDIHSVWMDSNNRDVTAAVADWGMQNVFRTIANQPWSRYAAPEQVSGDPIGSYTNIYRLGALSYHLLSGRPPYSDVTGSIEAAIAEQAPSPPSKYADNLPSRVDDIILQAMAPEPTDRYNSAYNFRVELLDGF